MPASQSQHEIAPAGWLAGLTPYFSCCCLPGARLSGPGRDRRKRAGGGRLVAEASSEHGAGPASCPRLIYGPPGLPRSAWTRSVPAESGRLNYFCTTILIMWLWNSWKDVHLEVFILVEERECRRERIFVMSPCAGRRLIYKLSNVNVLFFSETSNTSVLENIHLLKLTNKYYTSNFRVINFFVWMN